MNSSWLESADAELTERRKVRPGRRGVVGWRVRELSEELEALSALPILAGHLKKPKDDWVGVLEPLATEKYDGLSADMSGELSCGRL